MTKRDKDIIADSRSFNMIIPDNARVQEDIQRLLQENTGIDEKYYPEDITYRNLK